MTKKLDFLGVGFEPLDVVGVGVVALRGASALGPLFSLRRDALG